MVSTGTGAALLHFSLRTADKWKMPQRIFPALQDPRIAGLADTTTPQCTDRHRGSLLFCPSLTVPQCRNMACDFALLMLQSFGDLLADALHPILNPTRLKHAEA